MASKVRLVRGNKVYFSGSLKAFRIWKAAHLVPMDAEEQLFTGRSGAGEGRKLVGRIDAGSEGPKGESGKTMPDSRHGCYSSRQGNGA